MKQIARMSPMSNIDELVDQIYQMTDQMTGDQKQRLRSALGTQINIFFCGSAAVDSRIGFQINGESEEMRAAIEKVPPEAIADILKAIADMVARRRV
jgi:hypothetical protein